ncbi:MAG: ABC transporter permease [Desulfobacteraceae bacterium]|nr:ABC transporter permease [Desulfobacteraceae bacterium]
MIRFLLIGLLRDRSRSLFPVLMVSAGVFLTVVLYAYIKGMVGDMVDASARFDTGHVKIVSRAYHLRESQAPNDLALLGVDDLLATIRTIHPRMVWTPRIRFGGLLDVPDANGETRAQGPVAGLAIDLLNKDTPERNILKLDESLVRGRMPEQPDEILISETFGRKLGVPLDKNVTLMSATMYGSMTLHNFTVVGTVHFGMAALDRQLILVDINDAQRALDMTDGAGEILGFKPELDYADQEMRILSQSFNRRFNSAEDEFSPIMHALSEKDLLGEILEMTNIGGGIIIAVFVFAMSIVLWNAGLMNGIRRYGEIGVRLAMGESKGDVYRSMIVEAVCIGIIGSVVGTIFGILTAYWLQYHGLDFTDFMRQSTMLMSGVIRAKVTPFSYVIGFFPGLLASVIGTLFAGIGVFQRQTAQLFKELEV